MKVNPFSFASFENPLSESLSKSLQNVIFQKNPCAQSRSIFMIFPIFEIRSYATRQKPENEEIGCQEIQDHGERKGDSKSAGQATFAELQKSETAKTAGDAECFGSC